MERVREYAIYAAVMVGAGLIVFRLANWIDPILRPQAGPVERPPLADAAPKKTVWDREPGVVHVFEGGRFGRHASEPTPVFTVENDWSVEVRVKGDFWSIRLMPEKKPPAPKKGDALGELRAVWNPYWVELYDRMNPIKDFSRDFTNGGRYTIVFEGNGVWKATIRQGSGKID